MTADLTRRGFLAGAGATGLLWLPGAAPAGARRSARLAAASTAGTTLEGTIVADRDGRYARLVPGPPAPLAVREELATAAPGREAARRGLASIVHLTDVHVIDAQGTARVEFLDRYADEPTAFIPFSSAHRPQETLTGHVAAAMIEQVNRIARGPVTGRTFDCAVSTGDNIDNQQVNELTWFLSLLNGGRLAVNSGAGDRYEGVQDTDDLTYDDHYWHPDDDARGDAYKRPPFNFPAYPGLLEAAIAPFESPGLDVPWYSVYGNHDGLVQGNMPATGPVDEYSRGPLKVVNLPAQLSPGAVQRAFEQQDPAVFAALFTGPARPVTPDDARRFADVHEWIETHLDPPTGSGPGPRGHGLDEDNLDAGTLYFTFPIAPGVLGIALDSVNHGGYANGSIGAGQLAWLEARLQEVSSRYVDAGGRTVTTDSDDQLVVLFSHHNLLTMDNPFPDPFRPDEARAQADEVRALVQRYPNVVAWVNGHSHVNRVIPQGTFWEISTAAHVDWPQQARLVELADNGDGTLSIFGTIIDHAAPARAPDEVPAAGPDRVLGLASISREVAWNEPQRKGYALGEPHDFNVELLLPAPFDLATLGGGRAADPVPAGPPGGVLPATGGRPAAAIVLGGAAVAGSLALRRRVCAPRQS